jgi:hypothetical protein
MMELDILPKFFRHSRFQSFVRQLNFYAFKKISRERSSWVYSHKFFQYDKPHLLEHLRRKTYNQGSMLGSTPGDSTKKHMVSQDTLYPAQPGVEGYGTGYMLHSAQNTEFPLRPNMSHSTNDYFQNTSAFPDTHTYCARNVSMLRNGMEDLPSIARTNEDQERNWRYAQREAHSFRHPRHCEYEPCSEDDEDEARRDFSSDGEPSVLQKLEVERNNDLEATVADYQCYSKMLKDLPSDKDIAQLAKHNGVLATLVNFCMYRNPFENETRAKLVVDLLELLRTEPEMRRDLLEYLEMLSPVAGRQHSSFDRVNDDSGSDGEESCYPFSLGNVGHNRIIRTISESDESSAGWFSPIKAANEDFDDMSTMSSANSSIISCKNQKLACSKAHEMSLLRAFTGLAANHLRSAVDLLETSPGKYTIDKCADMWWAFSTVALNA